jgi:hypothetical protein
MNYFVLFSLIVIAAGVIVLLIPLQPIKKDTNKDNTKNKNKGTNKNKNNKHDDDDDDDDDDDIDSPAPSAAGQRSLSSAAGAADGSSDHQHLLDTLLQKHDALVEGMQNDDDDDDDDDDDNYGVKGQWRKLVGCSDKCDRIRDPADAVGGNCVNPPISDTNSKPDFSKRHCMAFAPPRGKPFMRDLECMTCGYYTYEAECKKKDPDNPDKCKRYGNYAYKAPTGANAKSYYDCSGNPICKLFLQQRGGGGGGQGYVDADADGPVCSAANCKPKEVTIAGVPSTTKCVVPGCLSNSGGLPYPKDFYGTNNINPCKRNPSGSGYMCPAVTSGSTEAYNSGGSSGDPCYTTDGKVDVKKFQSMNQLPVCNSVRPSSAQNFKPGDFGDDDDDDDDDDNDEDEDNDDDDKGDDNDDNDKGKKGKKGSQRNNNNGSVINVYHHYVGNRIKWSSYKNPESGLMYLGIY